MPDKKSNTAGPFQAIALTSMIGMEMATTVTLGFYGGKMLDRYLGTSPWLMITGVLLGVAAGIWGILVIVRHYLDF